MKRLLSEVDGVGGSERAGRGWKVGKRFGKYRGLEGRIGVRNGWKRD